MKIRKMKSNILSHFQNSNAETQVNIFQKGNYIYRINIIENENIIIYEDVNSEEYLCEMAQFKPEGYDDDFSILVAITPENRVGECYFKGYNNPKYSSATKVARISFIAPKLVTGHAEIGGKKEWNHPALKPIEPIIHMLKVGSDEGDVVLDMFMGSGTTGDACLKTNRKFIGIEKNDLFFEMAVKRIGKVFDCLNKNDIKLF